MEEAKDFCINLNILDQQAVWDRLEALCQEMPGWAVRRKSRRRGLPSRQI